MKKEKTSKSTLKRMMAYVNRYKWWTILALVFIFFDHSDSDGSASDSSVLY